VRFEFVHHIDFSRICGGAPAGGESGRGLAPAYTGAARRIRVPAGNGAAMGLLDLFRRKPPIASAAGLEDFLDAQSAFLVQKCIFEYSRARSGVLSSKLFKEPAFRAAVETARWRNYPLCLQNVAVMAEHALRPYAGTEGMAMRQGLIAAVGRICRRYPVPAGFDPQFWSDAEARIGQRIQRAGLAAPHAVKDLPNETAKEFFAGLPIHADLRGYDFELVTNNIRVNLCRAHEDFLKAADLPAVARALAAEGAELRA
jgi:hypothetical protein